jgi:MOSC domain-containing protein YiiM
MKQVEIAGLQIGMPRTHGAADAVESMDRKWTTGFYKEPVATSLWVTCTGITGDGQVDLRNHGGPDKAIIVYPLDDYADWSAELNI